MVIMYEHSNPYKKVCMENGETKILNLEKYNGEYDQGVAEQVDNNTILGVYTENNRLYLLKNNCTVDITDKNIVCTNIRTDNKRKFNLLIDDENFYTREYDATCTIEEIMMGANEADEDFLVYLSDVLATKRRMNNFIEGYSLEMGENKK